jgi:RNA polymerase sigma-70 factor (ECF subfamily)
MIASIPFLGSPGSARSGTDRAAAAAANRAEALCDADLVRRFNGGDESAFVEIVTRHRGKMFSVAFNLLRDRADAEEIVQDTFIRAYRGLARYRGDSALGTWLYRIALNLSHNRYWYLLRRCRHTTRSLDSALCDGNQATVASLIASDAPGPVQEAEIDEFSRLVASCLKRLTPGRREVLTQRNTLNSSYDEIAKALGINIGTVKSRIARARESLRVELSKACPEFASAKSSGEWLSPARASGCLEIACA